ncbi:outer membrane beta-barrel protein [Persicitalea jodogahamensis]|uniref:Outer membrane protein beta-barrel domain-containing protein n=1 Tax=Persicitalea jodogahamensis TaxID=402147 RepID=A0A8J3D633_9BACT|nr:outer membrane beta-barrel protein [Persicitalea jodogahamensis]GHB52905.1 hypothetical protein GCM10007390_01970 [Persicitalea jodogahamensis]
MNQPEKHKFEQEWQRAFESAAETPPPSAWDAIEKRLDGEKAVVLPLVWWKNPKVWYAAAAVVALLLVSWPILQTSTEVSERTATQLADKKPSSDSQSSKASSPDMSTPGVVSPDSELASAENLPSGRKTHEPEVKTEKELVEVPSAPVIEPRERIAVGAARQPEAVFSQTPALRFEKSGSFLADSPSVAEKGIRVTTIETPQKKTLSNPTPPLGAFTLGTPTVITITQSTRKIPAGSDPADDMERVIMGSSTVPLRTPTLTQSIAALAPVDELGELNARFHQPSVRNDLAVLEAAAVARPKRSRVREFWAGLGLMPAAFNPKMNVTSAPAAFASANAGRQALSNSSQAQLSYAVQAQAGKQLSKHWSIETGLSYLQGNSTFASDGYVLDAVTSRSSNVLEDALYSNASYNGDYSAAPSTSSSFDKSTGSYIDFDQRTSNDYRYIQLPVQAGYTLNPDGKLNYTVLGGVVANLFLQNELKTQAGYVFANTANDGLYHSLNWSAATGVRVNYRLSDHWNASLTGAYQKAIASILKGDGVLDSRPQLYGMAWGVRYVF